MSNFKGLLLLISLYDMSQGIGSSHIVCSASISPHVQTRTERSAFLSGTSGTQELLLWGSTAMLNNSLRGENTVLGLILNMSLNDLKVTSLEFCAMKLVTGFVISELIQLEKAEKLLGST